MASDKAPTGIGPGDFIAYHLSVQRRAFHFAWSHWWAEIVTTLIGAIVGWLDGGTLRALQVAGYCLVGSFAAFYLIGLLRAPIQIQAAAKHERDELKRERDELIAAQSTPQPEVEAAKDLLMVAAEKTRKYLGEHLQASKDRIDESLSWHYVQARKFLKNRKELEAAWRDFVASNDRNARLEQLASWFEHKAESLQFGDLHPQFVVQGGDISRM